MNKIVVITGASSGIGKELKRHFTSDGDIVVNISKNVETDDDYNYMCDVSDNISLSVIFKKINDKFNRIDKLINCAGFGVFGATELVAFEKVKSIMDVNFNGTLFACQSALKYMKKGASIINISSVCGLYAVPYRTLYSASKSAVYMLSLGLRMELKKAGIDVTTICPGDIKTNFSKNRDITLETNQHYGDDIKNNADKIASKESTRMELVPACKKIYKICKKDKHKPFYIVSKKYKALYFITRFVPTSWILYFTKKLF